MRISNKPNSDRCIKYLDLNHMVERTFNRGDKELLKQYLVETSYPLYNIRDNKNLGGNFQYAITSEQVITQSEQYDKYSVYESLVEADKNLILQGEIQVTKNFNLLATLDTRLNMSNREAMYDPGYHVEADLIESREPYIKGFTEVIDLVIVNELFDVVVEFSTYEIPVGVNKENTIIWELRSY